ncbi:MAG: DUF5688 family protein [Lachnospiraceae bacterium]
MMTYETFQTAVLQYLNQFYSKDTTISIRPVLKNNGTHLDGLTILEKNRHISPTIYLNPYYHEYQNGKDFDTVASEIHSVYEENKPKEDCEIRFFTDYEQMKSKVAYKIINYEKNKELLAHIPHIAFLDLAIVFYCLLSTDENGNSSILLHNSHLKHWNISQKELFEQAVKNTPFLLPSSLNTINEILSEFMPEFFDSERTCHSDLSDEPLPMYILTNTSRLNGACCMLYPDLLSEFAQKTNADLFILPSSIHEVILIPINDLCATADELASMVKDVNHSQVAEDEVLSDHVYYFSRETQQLTLCAG